MVLRVRNNDGLGAGALVAAALAAASACAAENDARVLRVAGEITPTAAEAWALDLRRGAYDAVVVRSAGGRGARALGDAVHQTKVRVVVDGYCVMTCASEVFLPARAREVRPGALVAFRNEVAGYSALYFAKHGEHSRVFSGEVEAQAEAYARWGLPIASLVDQFAGLGVLCVDLERRRFKSRYELWVPDRAWILRHGGTLDGFWPSDQSAARRAARRFGEEFPSYLPVGYSARVDLEALAPALLERNCPPDPAPV